MRVPRLPRLNRSVLLNVGLAVLVVGGAIWAYLLVTASPDAAAATTGGTTRTVTVSQGNVVATASASGSVQSASTATADFTTSGTVTLVSVKVGDTVAKGQVLAKVDPTEAQATLDTAEANLAAAKASLTRAKANGDDATIATAQAQFTSAQAGVDEAGRALAGTVLTAPMAGTVTAVNGSVGGSSGSSGGASSGGQGSSGSSSSSSGFISIADLTRMQVSASFAEADATKLKSNQAATVTWAALANATAEGKVATIAPTASTSNSVNSYAVTVSLDTLPEGIRIGQTVTVVVTVAQAENAIRVPTAAVQGSGNRHTVTVVANGQTQIRSVEIGVEGDTFTEITSGLSVGEQVQIVTTSSSTTNGNQGGFPGGGPGGVVPGGGFGGGPGGGR